MTNISNILLVSVCVMVLITMISSIIGLIVLTKYTKEKETVLKSLKVTGIILLIIGVIIISVSISSIKGDKNTTDDTKIEDVKLEDAGFNEVSLSEYLNLINSSEKKIVLVARPTCSFCEKFSPILKKAKDDMNLEINYIDTDKFSNDDWTTFSNSLAYLNSEEWGTPLVLIVQKGEVLSVNNGYVDLSTIKAFFETNGFGE